jgi:hypothetical protein
MEYENKKAPKGHTNPLGAFILVPSGFFLPPHDNLQKVRG